MNRYLLLILLSSWSLLVTNSLQCDKGVAIAKHALNVPQSLMANADVAVIKTYNASSVQKCMEECCSGKYGDCSVANFIKNTSKLNCVHFNCRPLKKCRFLSSDTTDSFYFSSAVLSAVPSSSIAVEQPHPIFTTLQSERANKSNSTTSHVTTVAKKQTVTISQSEQFGPKNDNTTVKPRKGVEDPFETTASTRSGIKPRKGVVMDESPYSPFISGNATKSKVKPRKGVGPYTPSTLTSPSVTMSQDVLPSRAKIGSDTFPTPVPNINDTMSNELIKALEKVFEDDPQDANASSVIGKLDTYRHSISPSTVESYTAPISSIREVTFSTSSSAGTLTSSIVPSFNPVFSEISETPNLDVTSSDITSDPFADTSRYFTYTPTRAAKSSTNAVVSSSTQLENIAAFRETEVVTFRDATSKEESEKEKKYRASMHLVLSLVFGLLVLFAVLGVVAKRVYDGWLRRHYRRMDFLIDGMYNGYE